MRPINKTVYLPEIALARQSILFGIRIVSSGRLQGRKSSYLLDVRPVWLILSWIILSKILNHIFTRILRILIQDTHFDFKINFWLEQFYLFHLIPTSAVLFVPLKNKWNSSIHYYLAVYYLHRMLFADWSGFLWNEPLFKNKSANEDKICGF